MNKLSAEALVLEAIANVIIGGMELQADLGWPIFNCLTVAHAHVYSAKFHNMDAKDLKRCGKHKRQYLKVDYEK